MTPESPTPAMRECPFCGGSGAYVSDYGDGHVAAQAFCPDCGCHGPLSDKSEPDAGTLWNRRTPAPTAGAGEVRVNFMYDNHTFHCCKSAEDAIDWLRTATADDLYGIAMVTAREFRKEMVEVEKESTLYQDHSQHRERPDDTRNRWLAALAAALKAKQ